MAAESFVHLHNHTQYSLLAGLAFSLFYAIMGIPLARIADSSNRRNLITWGIAVWSCMTAVCGMAREFWTLFLARVGVGVGEAALGPAAYSMITDYFPRDTLARALSVYMLGVTIGSGFGVMPPRDCLLTIGKSILMAPMSFRSRYFEYLAYVDLLREYFESDPECLIEQAPRPRLGPQW